MLRSACLAPSQQAPEEEQDQDVDRDDREDVASISKRLIDQARPRARRGLLLKQPPLLILHEIGRAHV